MACIDYDHIYSVLRKYSAFRGVLDQRADDIIQNTMLVILKKSNSLDLTNIDQWARNVFDLELLANKSNYVKLQSFLHNYKETVQEEFTEEPQSFDIDCFDLTNEEKECVRLAFYEEKMHAEICAQMGCGRTKVWSLQKSAFRKIKKCLQEN